MPERADQGRRWHEDPEDDFPAPLTREQARALSARLDSVSPWRIVALQAAVGIGVVLLAAAAGGAGTAVSALYGAACAVVPSAVLARGISRLSGAGPAASAVGVLFWEGMKVMVAVAMLAAAVRVVPEVSWPALLVAMGVCMSVVWLALLWRGRTKNSESSL